MQIRTEGPSREDMQVASESKFSVPTDKAHSSGPNFMDLMKSIQIRSQKVLEEGQKVSESPVEKTETLEASREPELFQELRDGEEDTEEVSSDDTTEEDSEIVKLSLKAKKQISQEEDSEEEISGLELEEESDLESPFIVQMSVFLANLESKKEKGKESESSHKEDSTPISKNSKQRKEDIQDHSAKEEVGTVAKPIVEEKRNTKEVKKSAEKESLDEGLKNLEDIRKLSKPANEEKAHTTLKEVSKENFIPESDNWKITREKKQESLSQISKSQTAKIAAAEDLASKGDQSGKGSQNQEFSQRQGNETTLTLLKAGLGVQSGASEVSGSQTSSRAKTNSSLSTDRSAMRENFQRLVQTAKLNIVENGKSEATLRLNPRELGRVSLRMSVEEDKVQGKILVESEHVRRLFAGDLEQLRKDFRDQGLQLESLTIEVEDSFRFGWGESSANDRHDPENVGRESGTLLSSSESQVSDLDSIENSEFADKNTDRRLNILV